MQSSSALTRLDSIRGLGLELEQLRAAAEEARRAKLYSIMACIREVQKRNDSTGMEGPCRRRAG